MEPFTVASHVLLTRRGFERASPAMMFRVQYRVKGVVLRQGMASGSGAGALAAKTQ